MMNTIDHNTYIVAMFYVSLLCFLVLSLLRRRTSNSVSHFRKIVYGNNYGFRNRNDIDPTRGQFRHCFGSADADVIIVGAGVTGAALAHTLGKVT